MFAPSVRTVGSRAAICTVICRRLGSGAEATVIGRRRGRGAERGGGREGRHVVGGAAGTIFVGIMDRAVASAVDQGAIDVGFGRDGNDAFSASPGGREGIAMRIPRRHFVGLSQLSGGGATITVVTTPRGGKWTSVP